MKKDINNNKYIITSGVLMVVLGIVALSYNYLLEKKTKAYDQISFDLFDHYEELEDPDVGGGGDIEDPPIIEDPQKPDDKPYTYNYIGTLEIPKINLKKGFVDINSPDNNISKNVTIIKPSTMPDVEGGNFILAAHSGRGSVTFFDKLYKLNEGDLAYIHYNGVKYTYKIVKIYTQPKTGVVGIYRDYEKTSLTLITCTNNDDTTQTIYIAELIDKE